MVESGGEFRYTKTDSQGCFHFLHIRGAGIGILPQKEGYFYNQRLLSGRPKDYSPDPSNPLIFTMWKIHGPEGESFYCECQGLQEPAHTNVECERLFLLQEVGGCLDPQPSQKIEPTFAALPNHIAA